MQALQKLSTSKQKNKKSKIVIYKVHVAKASTPFCITIRQKSRNQINIITTNNTSHITASAIVWSDIIKIFGQQQQQHYMTTLAASLLVCESKSTIYEHLTNV
jgi:hypothetical protein